MAECAGAGGQSAEDGSQLAVSIEDVYCCWGEFVGSNRCDVIAVGSGPESGPHHSMRGDEAVFASDIDGLLNLWRVGEPLGAAMDAKAIGARGANALRFLLGPGSSVAYGTGKFVEVYGGHSFVSGNGGTESSRGWGSLGFAVAEVTADAGKGGDVWVIALVGFALVSTNDIVVESVSVTIGALHAGGAVDIFLDLPAL